MPVAIRTFLSISTVVAVALLGACDSNGRGFLWQKAPQADAAKQPEHASRPTPPSGPAPAAPPTSATIAGAPTAAGHDVLVPFTATIPPPASTPQTCHLPGFTPPNDFKVYAAGAYAGRELDYQIDQSGHQATRIDVAVNHAQTPVVLMLGAYEPTVWNIGWSADTRISAVLVSGYHRQVVAGLPADVPVLISSYDNKGPCEHFYVAPQQLGRLNPLALELFGRPVDMVYPATDGKVLIGNSRPVGGLVTSARVSPDSFADPRAPLAGAAGLQAAVREGMLRDAHSQDMQAWTDALAAAAPAHALPPVAGSDRTRPRPQGRIHNGYVVLKAMQIPAGLYGAHSATFFVPKGAPRPSGNPGHSRILDFNTLTCTGATCAMD